MLKTEEQRDGFAVKSKVSRRGFLKGTAAVAAASALYGCGSSSDTEYIVGDNPVSPTPVEPREITSIYGCSTHNCGGRCVSRAEVSNGRILRILTDESRFSGDGTYLDPTSRNLPQTRSCARCRGYRYRIYHPGRLKYPLKQTGKRGDLSTFERITWDQALKEVSVKHKTVFDKYGVDGIYVKYDSAANDGVQGRDALDIAYRYMKGHPYKWQFGSYSSHQYGYFGVGYTGMNAASNANDMAKYTKTLVLWGENGMSTVNNISYAYANVAEDIRKRGGKVIFVGPTFSDSGVVMADEWLVSKPFTDPALVAGMVYHMLDNTFDLATGALRANPWLDIDWLDTMVYGFFDSPAYNLDETTGAITAASGSPVPAGTRDVPEVPAGKSYCSWVLGNNATGKKYSEVGSATNFTAESYAVFGDVARWAACQYEAANATVYKTKQDFKTPKTPAWAAGITGVPEEHIKMLAEVFAKEGPVASTWSGGQQKQADGIANLFAVESLHIITKNVSENGTTFYWALNGAGNFSGLKRTAGALGLSNAGISQNIPPMWERPKASCTAWHTIIKSTYINELKSNGYSAKYIPNWDISQTTLGDGDVYWDDAGTKAALLSWDRYDDPTDTTTYGKVKTYTDATGTYYQWRKNPDTSPVIAGIRLMYNSAGNIFINQHENSNDSMDMITHLDPCKYDDADSFMFVTFENFMSPTARYADYVLPTSTAWEHPNFINPRHAASFFAPQATNPPGEAKQAFSLGIELLRAYEKVDSSIVDAAKNYAGGDINNSIEKLARDAYYAASGPYNNALSPFHRKTWEEYVKNPILVDKPDELSEITPSGYVTKQNYNKLSTTDKKQAFIKNTPGYFITTNDYRGGGYDSEFADVSTAPSPSLKYQVYSPILTWQYVNTYTKWHGFYKNLNGKDLSGQPHKDFEGDRIVLEIPVYYDAHDYFMEAYGEKPAVLDDLKFFMTTTHNRYRSHSSLAENPMMRELNHRVPGRNAKGKPKQGNDFGYYANGPVQDVAANQPAPFPYLANAINADGSVSPEYKDIASYSEIYINATDGKDVIGIEDGDLVLVENPVGAVYCVARLTMRCARGYVDLHQGNWYDPRKGLPNSYGHESVDVGGNCNTLMASQPSRIDHGNGQQSAMVKISKVGN